MNRSRHGRNRTSDPSDISRVLSPLSYVSLLECPGSSAQCPGKTGPWALGTGHFFSQAMPRGIEPRSPERQSGILTAERWHRKSRRNNALSHFRTFALSHLCRQHGERESNPQPPVLETGALPVELSPCVQASAGSRTPGLVLTMDALCRLSYGSVLFRGGEGRTFLPCRAPPRESRATWWCGRRPSGPPSPARETVHENP